MTSIDANAWAVTGTRLPDFTSFSTTVAYGCLPPPSQPWPPDFSPPWYPNPFEPNPFIPNPFEPNPFIPQPAPIFPQPIPIPVGPLTFTWPPRTPEQRISELELRCAVLERRLADLETKKSNAPTTSIDEPCYSKEKPHETAVLPCICDELPPDALHWEGCPAGRDSRSHDDGLEFLRVWIDGHFGKLGLDTPTLHKIRAMIDSIGPKIRRRRRTTNR